MRQLLLALIMFTQSAALLYQRTASIRSNIVRKQSVYFRESGFLTNNFHHIHRSLRTRFFHRQNSIRRPMQSTKLTDQGTMSHSDESVISQEQTQEEMVMALPPGYSKGHSIISHATVPSSGFSMKQLSDKFEEDEIKRLKVTSSNVTVPVALMMLFPDDFDTLTRARKECRRKKIIVLRRGEAPGSIVSFNPERMSIGRVGDRV